MISIGTLVFVFLIIINNNIFFKKLQPLLHLLAIVKLITEEENQFENE